MHRHQQIDQRTVEILLGGEETRTGGIARLTETMPLDLRESFFHELAGRFEIAATAKRPGLFLQCPGHVGQIGESPEHPHGAIEVIERGLVMAGDRFEMPQVAKTLGLLARVSETSEDRQGLRVRPT
ncbi:MAG TPA: hypothetical protein VLR69_21135, partial [Thermoanaerobaculia bacterium]|nr:hypothetical protein [Thermoanaerobaculia bacterium]